MSKALSKGLRGRGVALLTAIGLLFAGTGPVASAAHADEVLRVMLVGDSIHSGLPHDVTARYRLARMLEAQGLDGRFEFVGRLHRTSLNNHPYRYPIDGFAGQRHEAWEGRAAVQVAGVPPFTCEYPGLRSPAGGWEKCYIEDMVSANAPDVILIHLGTNDLAHFGIGAKKTLETLQAIVSRAQAARPGVRVAVAKIIPFDCPTRRDHHGAALDCSSLEQKYAQFYSQVDGHFGAQADVTVVDMHSGFSASEDLRDGVHPAASGEAKLAQRWFAYLTGLIGPPQSYAADGSAEADAGEDVVVQPGAQVTLTGAGSAAGDAPEFFDWREIFVGGPQGALTLTHSGAGRDTITFTAPAEEQELLFELQVSDFDSVARDTVKVRVSDDAPGGGSDGGSGEEPGDGSGEEPGDGSGEEPGDGSGEEPGDGTGGGSDGGEHELLPRLAGSDRFATAARISAEGFEGASVVHLVTGQSFPDALAGSYAAAAVDGPILLTAPDHVPAATLQEIERLGAREVVLLGGSGSVSEAVASQLRDDGYAVRRIAGADRFQTAAAVAMAYRGQAGVVEGEPVAILASGEGFADALAVGPLVAALHLPLLLSPRDGTDPAVTAALEQLGIRRILIVGGTGAVGEEVEHHYSQAGYQVERVAGSNRMATAAALAELAITRFGFPSSRTLLARGDDYPDALSVGVLGGRMGAPILLTAAPAALSLETATWYAASCAIVENVTVVGGEGAVREAIAQDAAALAASC